MSSCEKYDLAVEILVKLWFGDYAYKVIRSLLIYGRASLRLLYKNLDLTLEQIQNILLTFLKHRIVKIVIEQDATSRYFVFYQLVSQQVLKLLRYPSYIKMFEAECQFIGYCLSTIVLQHGTINVDRLLELVFEHKEKLATSSLGQYKNCKISCDEIKQAIVHLVQCGYLQLATSFLDSSCSDISPDLQMVGRSQSDSICQPSNQYLQYSQMNDMQQLMYNGMPTYGESSFEYSQVPSYPVNSYNNLQSKNCPLDDDFLNTIQHGSNLSSSNNSAGDYTLTGCDFLVNDSLRACDTSYQQMTGACVSLNFDKLNQLMYCQHMKSFLISRCVQDGDVSAYIIQVLLDQMTKKNGDIFCSPIKIDQIYDDVLKLATFTVSSDDIFNILQNMCKDPEKFIVMTTTNKGVYYQLDWKTCVELLLLKLAKVIVTDQINDSAYRILNLLLDRNSSFGHMLPEDYREIVNNDAVTFLGYSKLWSDKEVAHVLFSDVSETRDELLQLVKNGWINAHYADTLNLAPLTSTSSTSSKHFYVFGTTISNIKKSIQDYTIKYLLNHLERQWFETTSLGKLLLRQTNLTEQETADALLHQKAADLIESHYSKFDTFILYSFEM